MGNLSCKQVCDCNSTMNNTGTNDCTPNIVVAKKLIYVPKYDSDGELNAVDLTSDLDKAYFDGLINETDLSKRWFPLPEMLDVDDNRAEAITQQMSDDSLEFIRDGIRTFTGTIWGKKASPILKGKIESARCGVMSVFIVDRAGNLRGGSVSDDGESLYPYDIDGGSLSVKEMQPKDKTKYGLQIKFNFDPSADDACQRMLMVDEMAADVNLLNLQGLKDIKGLFGTPTVDGVSVKLYVDSVNPLSPVTLKGLLTADFISKVGGATSKAYEQSPTPADLAITVAEQASPNEGTYDITFTVAQTTGDKIAIKVLAAGYDSVSLSNQLVTIP